MKDGVDEYEKERKKYALICLSLGSGIGSIILSAYMVS